MTRSPHVAGVGAVPLGRRIPESLEGVAPVAEVLRTLGDPFQFPGLDFGAVLSHVLYVKRNNYYSSRG